jgi:hypothetical protein
MIYRLTENNYALHMNYRFLSSATLPYPFLQLHKIKRFGFGLTRQKILSYPVPAIPRLQLHLHLFIINRNYRNRHLPPFTCSIRWQRFLDGICQILLEINCSSTPSQHEVEHCKSVHGTRSSVKR